MDGKSVIRSLIGFLIACPCIILLLSAIGLHLPVFDLCALAVFLSLMVSAAVGTTALRRFDSYEDWFTKSSGHYSWRRVYPWWYRFLETTDTYGADDYPVEEYEATGRQVSLLLGAVVVVIDGLVSDIGPIQVGKTFLLAAWPLLSEITKLLQYV